MMKKWGWLIAIGIIVVVLAIIGGTFAGAYNSLVSQSQAVDAQWAQVENQYQRRYDLIPNLVNSVKGAMAQETTIFTAIADARTRYGGATTVNDKVAAANALDSAVGRLLVVMENYPQLKSIDAVRQLMDELAGTENRVAVERQRFNDRAREYNTSIKSFPMNFLAGMFGFTEKTYFQAVTGASTPPVVNLTK
jgi:LemA protein